MRYYRPLPVILAVLLLTFTSCKKEIEENMVPVADAGANQSLTLPFASATLTGTGTDADGDVVAYLWSQVSGPGATVITNPGSPSTTVSGFVEGTYVFQLMVTDDKGAAGVDTTKIIVSPSPIKTLTLQPENNPLEYQVTIFNGGSQVGTGSMDIPVETWTNGGLPLTIRQIIKFDLSSIPQSATIISANLYLYSYPPPTLNGNFIDPNYGSDNTMYVQQVAANWSPASITWFNQPAGLTASQVTAAHTAQSVLDLNLDVKNIVSSMVSGNVNYGFLLKLKNEVIYTCRIFVSSYNTTYPAKHPKLVVVYQ